jgi:murein DD-endopeptidase MepM/ murein hydrolase activator NlpD
MKKAIFGLSLFFVSNFAYAQSSLISFFPSSVIQGEPLMIQVWVSKGNLKSLTFGGVPVRIFEYKNSATGIVGIDLKKAPGFYEVVASLNNGTFSTSTVEVKKKKIKVAPFKIPEKLGGNTTRSQKDLVATLAEENSEFKNIKTGRKPWWIDGFISPLKNPKVGDEFGYHRQLGNMIMAHKGVDYEAEIGTKVFATNDGIVRKVGDYRNYGKTIIIDHGLGVLSFYLHLSEVTVLPGQFVFAGDRIGLTGQTGYADTPHLHFSIRIYGVTVDPEKFLELFK